MAPLRLSYDAASYASPTGAVHLSTPFSQSSRNGIFFTRREALSWLSSLPGRLSATLHRCGKYQRRSPRPLARRCGFLVAALLSRPPHFEVHRLKTHFHTNTETACPGTKTGA